MSVEPDGAIETGCVCPACAARLYEVVDQGTTILACFACGGRAVSHEQVETMLARRSNKDALAQGSPLAPPPGTPLACPRCRDAMHHGPWTRLHPVAVDRCERCDLVWFGGDELAALQIDAEPEQA